MSKVNGRTAAVLRLEMRDAKNDYDKAKQAHAGAKSDAERKKALKDMRDAADTIANIERQLK